MLVNILYLFIIPIYNLESKPADLTTQCDKIDCASALMRVCVPNANIVNSIIIQLSSILSVVLYFCIRSVDKAKKKN